MARIKVSVVAGISAILAAGVGAQEKPQDDVIVTARKPLDRKEAQRFVGSISSGRAEGQMARLEAPVCPLVIGLRDDIARQIGARIRRVAKAVGTDVAEQGCAGNVVLVATPEGAGLVKGLRSTHPELLEGLEPREVRRLTEEDGPVRAWSAAATVNEDGQRMSRPSASNPMGPPTLNVKTASNVNPQSKRVIDNATVVIDSAALNGKTVIQIADYVTMRALAKTRPVAGGDNVGTILTLFDPAATPPQSVTEIDIAYLKALYALPGNRHMGYQISAIAKAVEAAAMTKP